MKPISPNKNFAYLTASLIRAHGALFASLTLLLALPSLLIALYAGNLSRSFITVERYSTSITWLIASLILGALASTVKPSPSRLALRVLRLLVIVLSIATINNPLLHVWIASHAGPAALSLFMLTYLIASYLFFFLPMAVSINDLSLIDAIKFAFARIREHKSSPLWCLLPAIGVELFLTGLFTSAYPDGRSLATALGSSLARGCSSTITLFMTCSYLRTISTPDDSHSSSTKQAVKQGEEDWLTSFLSLKGSIVFMCIALPLWYGNLLRYYQLAPAAEIQIQQKEQHESTVTLKLTVHDATFALRGLLPADFSIRTELGTPVSYPAQSAQNAQGEDVLAGIPLSTTLESLTLTFKLLKPEQQISELSDLYLWYRNAKLQKL
jgi:hypothetical protein